MLGITFSEPIFWAGLGFGKFFLLNCILQGWQINPSCKQLAPGYPVLYLARFRHLVLGFVGTPLRIPCRLGRLMFPFAPVPLSQCQPEVNLGLAMN